MLLDILLCWWCASPPPFSFKFLGIQVQFDALSLPHSLLPTPKLQLKAITGITGNWFSLPVVPFIHVRVCMFSSLTSFCDWCIVQIIQPSLPCQFTGIWWDYLLKRRRKRMHLQLLKTLLVCAREKKENDEGPVLTASEEFMPLQLYLLDMITIGNCLILLLAVAKGR